MTPAGLQRTLPARVLTDVIQMRDCVGRFRMFGDPRELERAFGFATLVVAALQGDREPTRPDLDQLRWLTVMVPEFEELLSVATLEAERVVTTGIDELWDGLGLRSAPPRWNDGEREAAKMVFACACWPGRHLDAPKLMASLRRVAAGRFAMLLGAELADAEDPWVRVLAGSYQSVRHRCAHRTKWRSLGLNELVRTDDRVRRELQARVERWLVDGGRPLELPAVLEAALVHAGTPPRFA